MRRWQLWAIAWCKLIDGAVGVTTLGFVMPSLGLYVATYFALKNFRRTGIVR